MSKLSKSFVPSYDCKYDEHRDIRKVSPVGAIDLKSAFVNNTIPSDILTVDGKFNGIDSPDGISTRVRNRIDAEVVYTAVKNYVPESNDVKETSSN